MDMQTKILTLRRKSTIHLYPYLCNLCYTGQKNGKLILSVINRETLGTNRLLSSIYLSRNEKEKKP